MLKLFKKNGLAKLDELYFPGERFAWSLPWWNLEENPDLRLGIQKELNLEIGHKHPLWGFKPVVFGRSNTNDDVLVHLNDGRFACVHLVWNSKVDMYPDKFPSTAFFKDSSQLQSFLNEEAEEYS